MSKSVPWWRKIDPALITPFRVLQFGLDTWDAALTPNYDQHVDGFVYAHEHAICIWKARHWIRELGPHLDEVLHEFTACAQGIARRGKYCSAASTHELAYRLLVRWLREVEERVMDAAHGATAALYTPPEFYEFSHANPVPEVLESIWDGEMRVWTPPLTYEGRAELKWQDIREYFEQATEKGRDAHYCPTQDEFRDMKMVLQQEVCRAYARRVEIRAQHDRPKLAPSPEENGESVLPVRKPLRPAESTVLEVIAQSKSRIIQRQIMGRIEEDQKLLGVSTVKAALGTLTTLGYIDNRQDVDPPGYAVTSMYPGIDFPD